MSMLSCPYQDVPRVLISTVTYSSIATARFSLLIGSELKLTLPTRGENVNMSAQFEIEVDISRQDRKIWFQCYVISDKKHPIPSQFLKNGNVKMENNKVILIFLSIFILHAAYATPPKENKGCCSVCVRKRTVKFFDLKWEGRRQRFKKQKRGGKCKVKVSNFN